MDVRQIRSCYLFTGSTSIKQRIRNASALCKEQGYTDKEFVILNLSYVQIYLRYGD